MSLLELNERTEISRDEFERNTSKAIEKTISEIKTTRDAITFIEKAIYLQGASGRSGSFENVCELYSQNKDIDIALTRKIWEKRGFTVSPGARAYTKSIKNTNKNGKEEYVKLSVFSVNDLIDSKTGEKINKKQIEDLKEEVLQTKNLNMEEINTAIYRMLSFYGKFDLAESGIEKQLSTVVLEKSLDSRYNFKGTKDNMVEAIKMATYAACFGLGIKTDIRKFDLDYEKMQGIKEDVERNWRGIINSAKESINSIRNNIERSRGKLSSGEKIVLDYLKELKTDGIIENYGRELEVEKGNSRYDFFAKIKTKDDKVKTLLIEYDGKQHYEEVEKFDITLEEVKEKDEVKNKYAKENKLNLLRIPYSLQKKEVQKMIEEKCAEIKRG